MWMCVTQPWSNIIATFFKGQMKRRTDKVCCTLCCPLEKGHSRIGSKREKEQDKESRTFLMHKLVRGVRGLNKQFSPAPPPYAWEVEWFGTKLSSCHWQSNQISAERTAFLLLSNKWKQHTASYLWLKVKFHQSTPASLWDIRIPFPKVLLIITRLICVLCPDAYLSNKDFITTF